MKIPKQKNVLSRKEHLSSLVKGKNVLHIGCTDTPFTKERIVRGELLHQDIMKSARFVVGLDVDREDITIMKDYGIEDVAVCSVYNLCKSYKTNKVFDVVVMTEVIEHLVNPGLALEEVRRFMLKNNESAKLIVTVPNMYSYHRSIVDPLLNREIVHPDHVSYYSYSTIKRLFESTGYKNIELYYASYGLRSGYKFLIQILNKFSSSFLPSIFVIAEVN